MICTNPSEVMSIPFWFFWAMILVGFGAGGLAAWVAMMDTRARLDAAEQLLEQVHDEAVKPDAWRMSRRLLRQVKDFLGIA